MTQTTDIQTLAILGNHAEGIQKFCNAQGRFWHQIFVDGARPTSRPSDRAKGRAYDGAYHMHRHFGLDRASTMLDLLDALDTYNAAVRATGDYSLRVYLVSERNRAAIVATLTKLA